jgi:hypothetical protein
MNHRFDITNGAFLRAFHSKSNPCHKLEGREGLQQEEKNSNGL